MSVAFYVWIVTASVAYTVAYIWLCSAERQAIELARLAMIVLCWPVLVLAFSFVFISRSGWIRRMIPRRN